MGKQFRFIMSDEDKERFICKVLENGKVYYKKNNEEVVQISSLPKTNWLHLYFMKDEFEKMISFSEETEYIDVLKLPILEFRQTYVRTTIKEIQRGRIYFENKYFENETLVYKDDELENWYQELVKWIKNNLICVKTFVSGKVMKEYVSASIVKYVEDGFNLIG